MSLEVNLSLIKKWELQGQSEELVISSLGISDSINKFSLFLEQFLLHGKSAGVPIKAISLKDGDMSKGLLCESGILNINNMNKGEEYYKALNDLKYNFEDSSNNILICNPYSITQKDINFEIKECIHITDKNFICILNFDEINPPFRYYEYFFDAFLVDKSLKNAINLIWCGSLEILKKKEIKCIRMIN